MSTHVRTASRRRVVSLRLAIGIALLLASLGTVNLVRVPAALAAAGGFSLSVTGQPPATAAVGAIVHVKVTITVGDADLTVDSIASGPATKGLDRMAFSATFPFRFTAGTSTVLDVSARLVGAPGSSDNALDVDMAGRVGTTPAETQTVVTHKIASIEAVTGALSATKTGGKPATTVSTTDRITYTLALTNTSDSPAQLSGLPAGLMAPAGTTATGSAARPSTVPARSTVDWALTVNVNASDPALEKITQAPTGVDYAVSGVVAARPVPVTPASVVSTVEAVQPPTLDVTFSPPFVAPNNDSLLTFHITNPNTNATLSGIAFAATLPDLLLIKAVTQSQCGGKVISEPEDITLSNGKLGPGQDCELAFTARSASVGNYLVFTNKIFATESGAGRAAQAELNVDRPMAAPPSEADLRITVSAPTRVIIGRAYRYTVTVTNAGPAAASSVAATLAVSGPDLDATTRHSFNTVDAGHSVSFIVTQADPIPGALTATATVTSTTPDPDPANDRAKVTTQVALF
jgi:hypothetical protein